jgi:valyl-tRNA synthetase
LNHTPFSAIVRGMEKEIPKTYTAADWEQKLYTQWEESGFFNPDTCIKKGVAQGDAPTFSIVLPPPNVTGTLHAGHAVMLALQDILVRYHRMKGDRTLWLPGTDHAAIATQSKVEKLLQESEGKSRYDLGREVFLKRVEAFASESHDTIVNQCRRMGSSLDWSREAYTLDQQRNLAVRTAFKKMYDDGIIYRGERIVNWDPKMQTTVSDDEIEWQTETIPLYYLQYGPFVIATARPETKFGDKYVVMHPDDERYIDYEHGQKITLEWINGPINATVIKDPIIDRDFGTGVMTITPWHDNTDFDIALRHELDREQIIDETGHLLPIAGPDFAGLPIKDARKKFIERLTKKGLVVKTEENYSHNIATNSRGGGIIEPQIKKQWFISVEKEFSRDGQAVTLKSLMQDAVRSKKITILPERFGRTYFHWIDNLRDWCISRQIWYGHRIPVWYRADETYCGIEAPAGDGWEQDPDTLDTWFSSGLWTFSTLGWPEKTSDLETYHPTSVLETGYDILFFWVARMILMSEYLLTDIPFKTVYLHGLVRDEQGRKMSKSLGNIIDPLDVIAEYGADAMRLSLVIGATPGNDTRLSKEKILSYRNFVNKLWNIGRYVSQATSIEPTDQHKAETPADRWILSRLATVTEEVTHHLDHFNISLAAETLRDFTWNDYADWYVEIHKIEKNDGVSRHVLDTLLHLWHPFMPFVTEALYQSLYPHEKGLLMVASWPTQSATHNEAGTPTADTATKGDIAFQSIIDLIQKIRNVRAVYHVDPAVKPWLTIIGDKTAWEPFVPLIERLARIEEVIITTDPAQPPETARIMSGDSALYIHLSGFIDVDKERARLTKEKSSAETYLVGLKKRLDDTNFTAKAPAHILEQNRASLIETEKKIADLDTYLANLA